MCFQAFPIFHRFSTSVSYTECKPKNKNARGLGTRLLLCLKWSHLPNTRTQYITLSGFEAIMWFCYMVCSLPSRSPEDTEGHEYVVLDAVINVIKDTKKHYALCLCCKGLSEMYFGVDDEDTFMDWLSRLNAASKFCVDRGELYQWDQHAWGYAVTQYKTLTHWKWISVYSCQYMELVHVIDKACSLGFMYPTLWVEPEDKGGYP